MDESYGVEVLHIVNPHLIFIESQIQKGVPVIQQVGIYGVLPVYKTVDIDGEVTVERCENWPVAANTVLREFLAEHKNYVYFQPIHVDERSTSIFDQNIHQFGDIIVKDRTPISITDHLVRLAVAIKDEPTFHQKLTSGSLKLKLNTARVEEVLTSIDKYYKKQRNVDYDWQKTINNQTSLHQENKKIIALTEENLKLLERTSQVYDAKYVTKVIEQKEKDLNLCKEADLVSAGRASRRSHHTSETPKLFENDENKPSEMLTSLKQFLVTHGKKKDNNDNFKTKPKDIVKQSTPKRDYHEPMSQNLNISHEEKMNISQEKQMNISREKEMNISSEKQVNISREKEMYKWNNALDSDDEWDSFDDLSKTEEKTMSESILNSNNRVSRDQNSPQNYEKKTNVSNEGTPEKKLSNHGKKVTQTNKNSTRVLKPKERRLVYCPDMEMNMSNLKNLVTLTITEDSVRNYANTVEEEGNKTVSYDEKNPNARKIIDNVNDTFDDLDNVCNKIDEANQKSHVSMPMNVQIGKVKNTGGGLNLSSLERKLHLLKGLQKNVDNNSLSSSSEDSCNKNTIRDSLEKETGSFERKANVERTHTVPRTEIKNTKASKMLSILSQQKKLQALEKSLKRTEHSSSASDTSVKDTSSSTEQSKIGPDELDQAKVQPDSLKLEPKPKTQTESVKVEPQPNILDKLVKIERNVNPFKNLDGSKSVFVEKLVTPILMVHTKNNNLILPQSEIRDVPFRDDIRMMLKSMRIQKPKRLQTVTWAYILRGHSMFIVGPAGNGKTLGYIPAVCNLVIDSSSKLNGVGPICIIVCATALSVSEVEAHCKRFLGVEEKVVTYYSGIDLTKTLTVLLNGCHVLICTAPALVSLLETDIGVDLRRLATLVLDDCERLSQVYTAELAKIVRSVKNMLKNRADKALKVQYVVASRQWCDFMTPLAKKAPDSVIAIGASQECVLYSKTKTTVNFVKSQANKVNTVIEFLGEIDRTKRIVIVCREDDEVTQLESTLTAQKYVVFACNNTMTLHDLCKLNEAWDNYQEPLLGPILVCCDGNIPHLNVTNAHYLVHFSLPPLFSLFCKRFSVLNENYASIFEPAKDDVKIKILLDEANVEQLPKILHFVKRCTKESFPLLDNVIREVMEAKDLKKAGNLNPICNNLLTLGECADFWNCADRHTVFKEYDEPKDWMPKQGLITFKITHYDSAVTYSARVLSNNTKNGPVKYPNNYNTLSLKMGMYYSKEANRKLHGVPKLGDICAVSLKPNFFERCKVMKVIPSDRRNTYHVLINLIDEEQMNVVSDVLLYYLPNDLKEIETHVVKVRLANIQPKDRDVTYSLAAKEHLQRLTDREREHGLYIRGQVVMTLGNTIFVDTAEACVDLSSLGERVLKRDFKKELLERHAEPNPDHIGKLKKISSMISTITVSEQTVTPKDMPRIKKCPKWAHLDKDESTVMLTTVVDVGTIFLRHVKFQQVLALLLKDIKEYVEKTPEIEQTEIYVGNFILAECPDDATYERARIDEIVNDKIVKCFFVDNGDWRQIAVDKLKPISENIMHRIPFQAIECRLVGVKPPGNADVWPEFSICWLDDNCFDDKDGNQKQLYAKYFTKEKATMTGGHKYGIVLLDTYSYEDIIVNKMMIELNLAKVIESEEKYINEPLEIKQVQVTDSSSDSDEDIAENNFATNNEKPNITDLVPFQSKESENAEANEIPMHNLLGKPIRSVPLVVSDSESDISDKWDVNVDKELIAMFGKPSQPKANITEKKTNTDINVPLQKTMTDKHLETEGGVATTNEKAKESCANSSIFPNNLTIDFDSKSQAKASSPDSDDFEINNDRIEALDMLKRIMSKDTTRKRNPIYVPEKQIKLNDTLDSDDLSNVTNEESFFKITEVDPPRKPKLVWRQNKNAVAIKVNLIGVEDYVLEIQENNIKFKSMHNRFNYEFEFELYGVVVPEKSVHSSKGQYIHVKLVKLLSRNWLSLTKDFSTKKWIVYDVDAIAFSSDEEDDDNEDARKAIKQNYKEADSSSGDDFDDVNYKYKKRR